MRKKDDEKVKSIKEAVIKLILQEGFHGTSVSKIAKMAGVSPATVYIYFENKEDMLHDIYLEYSEEIYDYLLDSIKRDMEGRQQIEVLIQKLLYLYIREPGNLQLCGAVFQLSLISQQLFREKGQSVIFTA